MHFDRTARRTRPIPLTSLMDIMVLLMIFFMLSTSYTSIRSLQIGFAGEGRGKEATLPPSPPAAIHIAKGGFLLWQRQPVTPRRLEEIVRERLARDSRARIVVRAGREVTVQQLVDVLDIAYRNGGRSVTVEKWKHEPERIGAPEPARTAPVLTEPQAEKLREDIDATRALEDLLRGGGEEK